MKVIQCSWPFACNVPLCLLTRQTVLLPLLVFIIVAHALVEYYESNSLGRAGFNTRSIGIKVDTHRGSGNKWLTSFITLFKKVTIHRICHEYSIEQDFWTRHRMQFVMGAHVRDLKIKYHG